MTTTQELRSRASAPGPATAREAEAIDRVCTLTRSVVDAYRLTIARNHVGLGAG